MTRRSGMPDPELDETEENEPGEPGLLDLGGDDMAEDDGRDPVDTLEDDEEDPDEGPDESSKNTLALLAGLAGFTVLAFTLYGAVLDLGFLGWDSFPLVWKSRCVGPGDVVGLFRTELMDGIYTDGHFYRPTTSLSFALNEAFSGLDARGYHLFDLGVLVSSAVLLVGLGRRLALQPATLAGAIAGFVFLLHPVQLALLPVPPRRADALSLGLLLACLYMQRDEDEEHSRALPIQVALVAFLAAGAKETGALVALLVPLLHLARRQRFLHVTLQTLPVVVGVGGYLFLRTKILAGLGGHAESGWSALTQMPELFAPYADRVLGAGAHGLGEGARQALMIGGCVAVIAASCIALWRPGSATAEETGRHRGALVFLGLWMVAELALASLAGRVHDWYALQLVAPFALLLGLLVASGARLMRSGTRLGLAPLGLTGLILLSLLVTVGGYRERSLTLWTEGDKLTQRTLESVLRAVDGTPVEANAPGQVVVVEGFVPVLPAEGLATVAILSDYSVDAYLELVRPEREVNVELVGPTPPAPPGAGELTVVLSPARR